MIYNDDNSDGFEGLEKFMEALYGSAYGVNPKTTQVIFKDAYNVKVKLFVVQMDRYIIDVQLNGVK